MAVDLSGKRMIVTGGAGVAVRLFAAKGARVLAVDIGEAAPKMPADEGLPASGPRSPTSAPSPTSPATTPGRSGSSGGVDGFVNDAGIEGTVAPLGDQPAADFDRYPARRVGLRYEPPASTA